MDELVVGALEKGAVNRTNGAQAFTGHASRHGHGMLLSDADIEILLGARLLKEVQTRTRGHGGRDAHHPGILLTEFDKGLAEDLAVARGLGLAGGVGLAGR